MVLKMRINAFELNTHTCWENEKDFKDSSTLNFGCELEGIEQKLCIAFADTEGKYVDLTSVILESYNPDSIQIIA